MLPANVSIDDHDIFGPWSVEFFDNDLPGDHPDAYRLQHRGGPPLPAGILQSVKDQLLRDQVCGDASADGMECKWTSG